MYKTIRTREQLLKAAADFAPTTACKERMLEGYVTVYKDWMSINGTKGWILSVHGKNRTWHIGFAVGDGDVQSIVAWPDKLPTGLRIVYGDRI